MEASGLLAPHVWIPSLTPHARSLSPSFVLPVTTDLADADVDAEFAALEKQIAQEEEAQKNSITTTATAPTATAANKSQPIAKATMQTAM